MYSIEFTKKAQEFFIKMPDDDALVLSRKLDQMRENPFRFLKKLQGQKFWRLRVMKYRVIIDVLITGKKITVLRIGKRKNVYGF